MSSDFASLAVFAEVNVGLVGFIAIFMVFLSREGSFSPEDAGRIQALIMLGLLGAVMALLPLTFSKANIATPVVWWCSSVVGMALLATGMVRVVTLQFTMGAEARKNIPLANNLVGWAGVGGALCLLILNVLKIEFYSASFCYTMALLLMLVTGSTNFLTITVQRLLK